MTSTHQILCGNCETPVEGSAEPDDNDVIKCAKCGQSDQYADVVESATNYTTDATGRHMQRSMKDAVRGSKFMAFKAGPIPDRSYRWIVADLNL